MCTTDRERERDVDSVYEDSCYTFSSVSSNVTLCLLTTKTALYELSYEHIALQFPLVVSTHCCLYTFTTTKNSDRERKRDSSMSCPLFSNYFLLHIKFKFNMKLYLVLPRILRRKHKRDNHTIVYRTVCVTKSVYASSCVAIIVKYCLLSFIYFICWLRWI